MLCGFALLFTHFESVINCAEVENKSLKNEKIEDQRTIIDLQQKLSEKKDNDFQ